MKERPIVFLFIILGVFLAFQMILIANVRIAQYDEAIFLDVARNIRQVGIPLRSVGTGRLFFDHTPFYVYMLGGLMTVLGNSVLLLRLVTVAFAGGTILLAYHVVWSASGVVSGLITAFLLAVSPFFLTYAFYVRMEIPFAFFLVLTMYFVQKADLNPTRADKYWFGAGLALMATVMFKEIGLVLWGATLLYLLFFAKVWRSRMLILGLVGVPTIVALAGWFGYAVFLDQERMLEMLGRWLGAWYDSPVVDPRIGAANLQWLQTVGGQLLGWPMTGLFLGCLLVMVVAWHWRRPPRIVWLPLLYLGLALMASLVMSLKEPRHLIGMIPALALVIGLIVDWAGVASWVRQSPWRMVLTATGCFLFIWLASPLQLAPRNKWHTTAAWLNPLFAGRAYDNDPFYEPLVEAADWVRRESEPDTIIITTRQGPVLGYYAERPYIFMYTRPFEENMTLLREADIVVLDDNHFWRQTPAETEALLDYLQQNFVVEKVFPRASFDVVIYRRLKV